MSPGTEAPGVVVVRARAAHESALAELFERSSTPCHCRYWHFRGDANGWLARTAHEPEMNRREMATELAAGGGDVIGIVALSGDRAVGWTKLGKSSALEKLYSQRIYRGLPCFQGDRTGVYALSCVLVAPDLRGKGLARALVRGAVECARAEGARALEAFPRRGEPLRDDELGTGPFSVFAAEGFSIVHDFAPYPVLRRLL